jgi:tetratricopeptide (TPR) repeat protein
LSRGIMNSSVFLSYARNDDEPFVQRLYRDLTACGLDIWWDRVSMPSRGLTFLQEIRDAINARERFLLIIGPKAVTSDYVVAEWRHALTYGKPLSLILRLGDFPLVPDELKLLHVEDFRDDIHYAFHFANLVRQLSEIVAPMGRLVGVPGLPPHLLARPTHLQALKNALLADVRSPAVVTNAAVWVGVHGMGGIGKSVLANMLARDTEVRRAFPDGIVWVPLGTRPNLLEQQHNLAKVFADDPGFFNNVDEGRAKLDELLSAKTVLLVLDDVWEREHLEAFNVLNPRRRAVITTRDAGLVASLGGTQYQTQLLTEAQAMTLLGTAAGLSSGQLPAEAKQIVSECDYLPLAVALCGGMARRGATWPGILERLGGAALENIADRNAENVRHRNLWAAMKVSVDALAPEERRRFVELSVFPDDRTIPEAAVSTLWSHAGGLDEFACEDLLIGLSERSLIRLESKPPLVGQAPSRHVSLHGLLHDFAIKLAGDSAPLHNRLLDAYSGLCTDGWASGPNDSYFYQNICRHLVRASRETEMYKLLTESPRWMDTKYAALHSDESYVADLDYACGRLPGPQDGLYLTALAKLHTAKQVVFERAYLWEEELELLVRLGRVTEAVGRAQLRPEKEHRLGLLVSICELLRQKGQSFDRLLDDVATLAAGTPERRYSDVKGRAAVLLWSAGKHDAAVSLAKSIRHDVMRAQAVRELAACDPPQTPPASRSGLLSEAIDEARGIRSPLRKAQALVQCAEALLERDPVEAQRVLEEALSFARSIEDPPDVVAPRMEGVLCDLALLFSRFDENRAGAILAEVRARASSLSSIFVRESVLMNVVEGLVKTRRFEEAIDVTNSVSSRTRQEALVLVLATGLAERGDERADIFFDQAVEAQLEDLSRVGGAVGPPIELSTGYRFSSSAVGARRAISGSLCDIVKALAQNARFAKARIVIGRIPDPERRALAEAYLADALSRTGQFQEAIDVAQQISDSYWRANALRHVSSNLAQAGDPHAEALFAIYRKQEIRRRNKAGSQTIYELVKLLAAKGRTRTADALSERLDAGALRVRARCAIVRHGRESSGGERVRLLEVARNDAEKITDSGERVEALCELGVTLSPADQAGAIALLGEAASVARAIQDVNQVEPARALRQVAVAMSAIGDPAADGVWEEARAVAGEVTGYAERTEELAQHAVLLALRGDVRSEELFARLAAFAPSIRHDFSQKRSLSLLSRALAHAGKLQQAIECANSIPDQEEKALGQLEIVKSLAASRNFDQAAAIARSIGPDSKRAEALTALGSALHSFGDAEADKFFNEALSSLQSIEDPGRRPYPRKVLAGAFAAAGRFQEAFSILGPRELNEFVLSLAQWSAAFDRIELNLSITLISEVIRVIGWVSEQFEEIGQLLAQSDVVVS